MLIKNYFAKYIYKVVGQFEYIKAIQKPVISSYLEGVDVVFTFLHSANKWSFVPTKHPF